MHEFHVERRIEASSERIWSILTNAQTLANGQFGIARIDGDIALGSRIKLWSEAAPGRAFPLRVATLERNRTMVWTGGMPLGLFTGTRTFRLTPDGAGTVFLMTEVYTGPMVALIWRSMPDLDPSFRQFADGLARTAEST